MALIAHLHRTRSLALHLRVKQTQFSERAKERLHRVGSPARWLPVDTCWDYPLSPTAVIALDAAAKDLGETIEWHDDLRAYADAHLKQAAAEHEVRIAIERVIRDKTPLDPYVTRLQRDTGESLLPAYHQQVGYHWSQRVAGLLLAWDPGTGKTRGATDASGGWYRNGLIRPMTPTMIEGRPGVEGGVLVVCPKTMTKTWQIELMLWQSAAAVIVGGSASWKMRRAAMPAHYHIINYESLKYVAHNRYDGLIVDEIHRAANHTNQTMHVLGISQLARKRLGLSGTPIANHLESIFYPMLILDGGKSLGSSRTAFLEKYFYTVTVNGGFTKHDAQDGAPERIAQAMAESTYFVRKAEVLDLPSKTHTPIYLDMTDEQERYYNQIKNETITYIQDATVTGEQASARMMKLLQVCQGFVLADERDEDGDRVGRDFSDAKTKALLELLTGELSGRKILVWAQFRYELKRIADMLAKAGIPYVRIDGSIKSQRERDASQERWNSDPTLRVYLRQLSMSEGVTLLGDKQVPCFDCVYMGLNYSHVHWAQSQDRIHRIGQRYSCSYRYLLTATGVARGVYDSVLDKNALAKHVENMGKDSYRSNRSPPRTRASPRRRRALVPTTRSCSPDRSIRLTERMSVRTDTC